jgi:hypothetical protein
VKKIFIAISMILLFLAITGIQSFAQDVIHVCINNAGHARFVSDPSECKINETPKSWYVTGPQGPQGEDGQHCWDLNGNGVCDPEEDVDGIAGCGAGDCQGPQGEPGPQGPSGEAVCLGVYDGDDTFLGYPLEDYEYGILTVFNPDIPAIFYVDDPPSIRTADHCNFYYTGSDCSGTMYAHIPIDWVTEEIELKNFTIFTCPLADELREIFSRLHFQNGQFMPLWTFRCHRHIGGGEYEDQYFIVDMTSPVEPSNIQRKRFLGEASCETFGGGLAEYFYPVTFVENPLSSISEDWSLTPPIVIRPIE